MKRLLTVFLISLMITFALSSCEDETEKVSTQNTEPDVFETTQEESIANETIPTETAENITDASDFVSSPETLPITPSVDYFKHEYQTPEDKLADMVLVTERYGYQLYVEKYTGEVAFKDTATGQVLFTNPYDIASPDVTSRSLKETLMSQILLEYTFNNVSYSSYNYKMESYEEAALHGQITVKNIKNGIRVEYALGEDNVTRLVPRVIEKSRFEEEILNKISTDPNDWTRKKVLSFYSLRDPQNMTDTERQIMETQFPVIKEKGIAVYVCNSDITFGELRTLEGYFQEYCPEYTYDSLNYDHEMTGYIVNDPAPPRFTLALEYVIDQNGLSVTLPSDSISYDSTLYTLETISILPFFGVNQQESDGYLFIPYESTQASPITTLECGPSFGMVSDYVYSPQTSDSNSGYIAFITESFSNTTLTHPYYSLQYVSSFPVISLSSNEQALYTANKDFNIYYVMLKNNTACINAGLTNYYSADSNGIIRAYWDNIGKTALSNIYQGDLSLYTRDFDSFNSSPITRFKVKLS